MNYAQEFRFNSKHNGKLWEDLYFSKITLAAENSRKNSRGAGRRQETHDKALEKSRKGAMVIWTRVVAVVVGRSD